MLRLSFMTTFESSLQYILKYVSYFKLTCMLKVDISL